MNRILIKHAVWPTKAPDGPTVYWDQESWDKFADGFRPPEYQGDRFDQAAWEAFDSERKERYRRELYHRVAHPASDGEDAAHCPKCQEQDHMVQGKQA